MKLMVNGKTYEDLTERERLCYQSGYEYGSFENDNMIDRYYKYNGLVPRNWEEQHLFDLGKDKARKESA